MNLNDNPTVDQLRDLLRPLDDHAAHHVVWVDRGGEVHVTPMEKTWPAPRKPGPDVLSNALVYFEPLWSGNGYVGPDGAASDEWINDAFDRLTSHWAVAQRQNAPAKMIRV